MSHMVSYFSCEIHWVYIVKYNAAVFVASVNIKAVFNKYHYTCMVTMVHFDEVMAVNSSLLFAQHKPHTAHAARKHMCKFHSVMLTKH